MNYMDAEIRWLESTSRFLAEFYGEEFLDSLEYLSHLMEDLRSIDGPGWTSFRDFILMKHLEEDWSTEWVLSRKVSELVEFSDQSPSMAFGYVSDIDLPDILDHPEPP